MLKLKKDYLISMKMLICLYAVTIAVAFMMYFIITNSNNNQILKATYDMVAAIVEIGTATIAVTPVAILFCIVPLTKNNSDFISTLHLPLSKKEIMVDGIKKILPYFIIWIVLSNLVATMFRANISNDGIVNLYFEELISSLSTTVFVIIIEMQVIAATILAYAKDISWYKIVPVQIIVNIIILVASYSLLVALNFDMAKDMTWLIIIKIIVAIFSIIESIYSFKYIEEVCR